VKDEEICWGVSYNRSSVAMMTLEIFSTESWREFGEEHGGMEEVWKTIGRRRQSSADGQKKNI
jgi:hypothetical protein